MAAYGQQTQKKFQKKFDYKAKEDAARQCLQAVDKQLSDNDVIKDNSVTELYLANQELTEVCSLSRFKNLNKLWLNNNLLCSINNSLLTNYTLVELYLQNNRLNSITGSLRHLRTLRVLMLQNNQLRNVEKVVAELEKMQDLRTLNLFHNPVSQEPDYRFYVLHHIPSVELLDRREVLQIERDLARRQFDQDREAVRATIAFGRRSEGPPILFYRRPTRRSPTRPMSCEVGNNFYRSHPPYPSVDEAFHRRLMKKSTMEFSYLDWGSLPASAMRRTSSKPVMEPQIITVNFR